MSITDFQNPQKVGDGDFEFDGHDIGNRAWRLLRLLIGQKYIVNDVHLIQVHVRHDIQPWLIKGTQPDNVKCQ